MLAQTLDSQLAPAGSSPSCSLDASCRRASPCSTTSISRVLRTTKRDSRRWLAQFARGAAANQVLPRHRKRPSDASSTTSVIATSTWTSKAWAFPIGCPSNCSWPTCQSPLNARVELPEGETWSRDLRIGGRPITKDAGAAGPRLSEPRPVAGLLREYDGVIILGDPGAGKTTFLKYLAVQVAIGHGADFGLDGKLPVLLPLSAYAHALAARDVPLQDYLAEYYRGLGVDLPVRDLVDTALAAGDALLLMDGLDEVKEVGQRHLVVDRVVDFFTFHRTRVADRLRRNKFVLTTRIVGYRDVRRTIEGIAECTLVDFGKEEITEFVGKWTRAIEQAARGRSPLAAEEASTEQEALLAAIDRSPGVRGLAANPLLLTILALMKRQGISLPDRRIELYQKYVETLLKHWNLARSLGRPLTRDLDVTETMKVLAPLALWMHETSAGVGLVRREEMRRKLAAIYRARGMTDPDRLADQFLADVRDHAGLLLERGPGEVRFHPSDISGVSCQRWRRVAGATRHRSCGWHSREPHRRTHMA